MLSVELSNLAAWVKGIEDDGDPMSPVAMMALRQMLSVAATKAAAMERLTIPFDARQVATDLVASGDPKVVLLANRRRAL